MKKILTSAIMAVTMMTIPSPSFAGGGPGIRHIEHHYSDPGMQNEVGTFIEYCDNNYYSYGHPDAYNTFADYDC